MTNYKSLPKMFITINIMIIKTEFKNRYKNKTDDVKYIHKQTI